MTPPRPGDLRPRIAAFATKGTNTNDEHRLRRLLSGHDARFLPYDKSAKRRSGIGLLRWVLANRPDLLVMEGTGLGGGLVCLLTRLLVGQRYVVSSGDAVGPFVAGIAPLLGPVFGTYERLLCRLCSGYIGWTPYLAGRALTFGAPRAMTAAGWSDRLPAPDARLRVRAKLGIPLDSLVFGLVGSLDWNRRYGYCYGWELVQAARAVDRPDVYVLIVGGGSGLDRLREAAGDRLGRTILLPGPVPADQVVDHMAAMDVGSLPQSVDGVGSFRYTTKLSEYLAAGLPVVTGQIPLAYDLDDGWLWRLPGNAPWSPAYTSALAALMGSVTPAQIGWKKAAAVASPSPLFDVDRQVASATSFIADLLRGSSSPAEIPSAATHDTTSAPSVPSTAYVAHG